MQKVLIQSFCLWLALAASVLAQNLPTSVDKLKLTGDVDASGITNAQAFRSAIGANSAANLTTGLLDDARLSTAILRSTTSYANPAWITSLAFSKLTSLPNTLTGYGISDGVSMTGVYANPAWLTSLAFSKLSSLPTTRAGYGITDAQPLSSTLSDISPLATTPFGRSLLTLADSATARQSLGLANIGTSPDDYTAIATSTPSYINQIGANYNGWTVRAVSTATGGWSGGFNFGGQCSFGLNPNDRSFGNGHQFSTNRHSLDQTNSGTPSDNVQTWQNDNRYHYNAARWIRATALGGGEMGAVGGSNDLAPYYASINYLEDYAHLSGFFAVANGKVYWGKDVGNGSFVMLDGTSATYDSTKIKLRIQTTGDILSNSSVRVGGAAVAGTGTYTTLSNGLLTSNGQSDSSMRIAADSFNYVAVRDGGGNNNSYRSYGGTLAQARGHVFLNGTAGDYSAYRLNVADDGVGIFAPSATPSTTGWYNSLAFYLDETAGAATPALRAKVVSSNGTVRLVSLPDCKRGTATLVAGTVTVSNANVTTSSEVFVTNRPSGYSGAIGGVYVSAQSAGSFTITSNNSSAANVVAFQITNP